MYTSIIFRSIVRIVYYILYAVYITNMFITPIITTSDLYINCNKDINNIYNIINIVVLIFLFTIYLINRKKINYKDIPLYTGEIILHTFNYTDFYIIILANDILFILSNIIFILILQDFKSNDNECTKHITQIYIVRFKIYIITAFYYHVSKLFITSYFPEKKYIVIEQEEINSSESGIYLV